MISITVASRLPCTRRGGVFASCGRCLAALLLIIASNGLRAEPTALHADLSLGAIAPATEAVSSAGAEHAAALAHFAAGRELELEGRQREALVHYQAAVKATPGDAELVNHTAEVTLNFVGHAEAVRLLEDCVKASPSDYRARLNLARFLTTYPGDDTATPDRISQVLSEALTKFPLSAEVYREAAMMHLTRNKRSEAEKVLETAANQTVPDPDFWLATGRVAQQLWPLAHPDKKAEHRAKVNPFFEKALALAGAKREDVRMAVAQYYVLSNQLDRATEVTADAVRKDHSVEAKRLLVRLYQAQERDTDAMTLLEEIVKTSPDDIESRRLLVTFYEEKKDYAQAVPHAETLIQKAGGSADDYAKLGALLLSAGEFKKSGTLCTRGMALFPSDPRFPRIATFALRREHRLDDALKLYGKTEQLIREGGNTAMLDERFYSEWADTLQSAERYDEASRMYQKAIDLVPQTEPERAATILNNLGYMWLELHKNLDEAGKFITRATELDPNNPVYMDSLGWFHFLKGDHQEALKVLLAAVALIPQPEANDAEIIDHIAQTYLKLGDKAKALEYFKQATALDPNNAKIRQRLEEAAK